MCGIAGVLTKNGSSPARDLLSRMIAQLHHRGPDAYGVAVDGPAGLAHARLSIIDLEGGVQPMASPDGRVVLTFNGEIFNYIELREQLARMGRAFRTSSDTENCPRARCCPASPRRWRRTGSSSSKRV